MADQTLGAKCALSKRLTEIAGAVERTERGLEEILAVLVALRASELVAELGDKLPRENHGKHTHVIRLLDMLEDRAASLCEPDARGELPSNHLSWLARDLEALERRVAA